MHKNVRSKTKFGQAFRKISLAESLHNRWLPGSIGRQKLVFILLLSILPLFSLQAQTTYTWNGGASGSWGTSTNWSPTRTTPSTDDIIHIDISATITDVPTESIGQLLIGNSATVALSSAVNAILTLNGGSGTDLDVTSGSTLKLDNPSAFTPTLTVGFSGSGNTANINGMLILSGDGTTIKNTFDATNAIVTVNGTIESAGTITSDALSLNFNNGSFYKHQFKTISGVVPTATWNTGSHAYILGYTNFTAGITGLGQTFADFTFNCALTGTTNPSINALMNVTGTFNLINTGASGALKISSNSALTNIGLSVNNYTQTGGKLILYNGPTTTYVTTLKVSGTFNQTGGSIDETGNSTANNIEFNGTTNQSVKLGTISNLINYKVLNNAGITLQSTLTVNSSASLTIASTAPDPIIGTVSYSTTSTTLVYDLAGPIVATSSVFPATNGPVHVTINNTATAPDNYFLLPGDRTLNGTLTLSSGLIRLGSYHLTMNSSGSISIASPSATKMIVINGTGQLKKTFSTANTAAFTFPIGEENGTPEYSPVTLDFATNSIARTIGVSVTNAEHGSMHNGGSQTDYLDRYWSFSDNQTGTYSYAATFQYTSDDLHGTEANMKVNRWNGTGWAQVEGSAASYTLTIPPKCE